MTSSNSRKVSLGESISSPVNDSAVNCTAEECADSSPIGDDHKQFEVDFPIHENSGSSMVTLMIQNPSDENDDDDEDNDKQESIIAMKDEIDQGSCDTNHNPSSSPCGDSNVSISPVASIHSRETSDIQCSNSPMKESIPGSCQFTIGDPTKQQKVYCQEKDGVVYFISWMDKKVRSRRISKLGAQHDTVITYDPSTDTLSSKQFICCRANMTYAFGILNFKNRIVLVAGDNPKFLDGSVYLYQLVECKKYQRAFSYKWNKMATSVRSCSPVVASPTHAVCTTVDNYIMVCQLTNNSDCTLKGLSINIYDESCCNEEDTKWKVVSFNLPATLLHENGHLTSGTVHQKSLYLSIKTSQGFGVMRVSVPSLDGLERSSDSTIAFHSILEESPLTYFSLFNCSDKLLASSVSEHALSSCSIGIVTITTSSIKQTSCNVQAPLDNAELHSVISVPNCSMLILVYYNAQLQSYILKSISSVF